MSGKALAAGFAAIPATIALPLTKQSPIFTIAKVPGKKLTYEKELGVELFASMQEALYWLPALWVIGLTQVFGLTSAWLVRASEGSRNHLAFQGLFMLSLAAVGMTTMLSLCMESGGWYLSGATMSVMVVAATYRPHGHRQPAF